MDKIKRSRSVFWSQEDQLMQAEIYQEIDRRAVEFCRNPFAVPLFEAIQQHKALNKIAVTLSKTRFRKKVK